MRIALNINDNKVSFFMELMKNFDFVKIEEKQGLELSDAHKAILDQRKERHLKGESKSYTWEEVQARVRAVK